jgi:hypothetical protein
MVWRIIAMTSKWNQLIITMQSLRSISENDKANQIMEKFDQMSETIVEETFAKTKTIWMP